MQFDEAVGHSLNSSMKRIRIKVDPMYATYNDFRNINSYEGYVVVENEEYVRIMVIKPNLPIITIPRVGLMSDGKFNKFKQFLIYQLEIDKTDPLSVQIQNCEHLEDIEIFLKQEGKQDMDLVDIYRKYIINNEIN